MRLGDRRIVLGVLIGGPLIVGAAMMARGTQPAVTVTGGVPRTSAQMKSGEVTLNDVKLELLERTPAALDSPGRNPFRFEARPAPAPARLSAQPTLAPPPSRVMAPAGPPPPPPITLRFIGLVEAPSQAGRVAILSDGRGNVFYGKEGDTVEGRYRMLKIGPEAVELSYIDGRGRQTIRLSGQ
jgi:hypothetical protein